MLLKVRIRGPLGEGGEGMGSMGGGKSLRWADADGSAGKVTENGHWRTRLLPVYIPGASRLVIRDL
jgi:hypothetical protein